MASEAESKVQSLMETFAEHFVKEYETQLALYNLVLRGEASKSGKIAETLSGKLGQGLGGVVGLVLGTAVGMPGAGARGGASVGESLAKAVGDKLGSQEHAKKVQCVSELLKRATESKEDFRRSLVEAAADVFQSFEMQFCRVTSELSPDNAMVRLAQDAVNRSISYFVAEQKSNVEINIAHSIMLGKSKIESVLSIPVPTERIKSPGYEVTYKHTTTTNTWNTASLYTKVGIVRNNEYFKRMDSSSRTDKYGYRKLLSSENWECMKSDYKRDNVVESKSSHFADYNYILNTNNIPEITSSLLRKINDNDTMLSEKRIKELILECNENIISEIKNLKEIYKVLENKTATEIIEHLDTFEKILIKSNFVDFYAEIKSSLIGVFNQQEDILGVTRKTAEDIQDIKATIQSLNQIPVTASILFNVKKPVKSFTGRSKELEDIHSALQNSQREVVISQVASVCGLGGIGKSELARKYASEYEEFYDHNIVWINAESQRSLIDNFLKLSELTKAKKLTDSINISDVTNNVYMYFRKVKCLFIFDNVEEFDTVQQFLPLKCSFSSEDKVPFLLITSRNQEWDIGEEGDVTVLQLNGFSAEEAIHFVKKSLNIEDDTQDKSIEEFIKDLEYFPLVLAQAAAYINEKNIKLRKRGHAKYQVKDYISEMASKKSDFLKFSPKSSRDRYINSVYNTWEITLQTIKREEDIGCLAIEIFYRLSYLAADDIVADALVKCYESNPEPFWDSIDILSRYSMITFDNGLISIHRLVQEVTRLKMKEAGSEEQVLYDIIRTMTESNWIYLEHRIQLLKTKNSMEFQQFPGVFRFGQLDDSDQEIISNVICNSLRFNLEILMANKNTVVGKIEAPFNVLSENQSENMINEKGIAWISRIINTFTYFISYFLVIQNNKDHIQLLVSDKIIKKISKAKIVKCDSDVLNSTENNSSKKESVINEGYGTHPKSSVSHINETESGFAKSFNETEQLSQRSDIYEQCINEAVYEIFQNIQSDKSPGHMPLKKVVMMECLSRLNDEIENIWSTGDRHITSVWKHAIIYDNLLEKFHDNRYGNQKFSLFHILTKWGDKNAIERLISYFETKHEKDISTIIDGPNLDNDSPLHISAASNELEIVEYLISKSADYRKINSFNLSPFEVAAVSGNLAIVMFFVKNKLYPSLQICPSQIVWMGHVHIIRYLIEARFHLCAKYEGPLHLFIMYDPISLCLLQASIETMGCIFKEKAFEMAELLLKHFSKRNTLNQTPKEAFSDYLEKCEIEHVDFDFGSNEIHIDYDEAKTFVWNRCCGLNSHD